MRRRRRSPYSTHGPVKPPKVAKPKPIKLNLKALSDAYKKFVVGSITARIQALYEALNWWDAAIPVFLGKKALDSSGLTTFERANKARAIGIGTASGEEERETALRTCIKQYEKLWADEHQLPKLSDYVAQFDADRAKLEAQAQALRARYEETLGALKGAFAPLGLEFSVQKSPVARQFDGLKTIILSDDLCRVLISKSKTEGLISVLFSEAVTALKASSLERNEDGSSFLNVRKLAASIPVALSGILQYCGNVPRNKVFKCAPDELEATVEAAPVSSTSYTRAQRTYTPRAPKDPNAAPKPTRPMSTSGGMVGGLYRPNSSIATIFQRLEDQKPHTLAELGAGLSASSPLERIKWIVKHGKMYGKWTCTVTGQTVQLTIH